ncbi:MAG: GDYXXLXY domain-containing protein [Pseudomonadota bacterium]
MTRRGLGIGLIAAAVFQTAVLAFMLVNHQLDIKRGVEVVLESNMRDPRDLFRGHYTRLQLAISRLSHNETAIDTAIKEGPVYAVLEQGSPFWRASRITNRRLENGVFLEGRLTQVRSDGAKPTTVSIEFPFSRYYAQKRRALELERLNRNGRLGIILSVLPDGSAKIKGISVDGTLIADESLF